MIMVFALLVFLVVFYLVANAERPDDLERLSTTEATIQRDLNINYPQTPKAVVRYYAELSQCMYDPSNSDEEIEAIAKQSRLLFDDELKGKQSDAEYLASLKNTVASFIKDNRKIVSFTVTPSSEVVYKTLDIGEIASLYCTYTMQKGAVSYSDSEHFLLRRDGSGRWKILGWQSAALDEAPVDNGGADEEEEESLAPEAGGGNSGETEAPPKTEAPAKTETPKVNIEVPTIERPTVEIEIPGVK